MAVDPAAVIDRRRLKRRLIFWRVFAIVAAVGVVLALAGRFHGASFGAHIARLSVSGVIFDDPFRANALDELAADDKVRALIVAIDSPGGTFVGGEALYESLRKVAEAKPVVAVLGGTAASAAYMVALGADHIVARKGTVTGSIGVIMQTADITGLLDKLGIKPETIKSGPLKAQPNPLEPFSPAAREATEAVVEDLFGMFVDLVAARREMDRDKVLGFADGRVFSGRQAMRGGLVDAIGAEAEARRWLVETKGIEAGLDINDVDIDYGGEAWRDMVGSGIAKLFGKDLFSERLRLDGVISLWHPDFN
ncbi:MAG: signal peptide peptidase SppA [Magnetovibrio sp.]|nr:signal peptide peptidase SppA [Magnetovibrio sp.]